MSLWYIIIDRKYESKQHTLRVNCNERKDASWLDTSARKRRTRIDDHDVSSGNRQVRTHSRTRAVEKDIHDQTCKVEKGERAFVIRHVKR